jgi:DNA repair exonuclease SbcCD nuclease subunit
MMKILHAADLHLDTAFSGRSEAQVRYLRQALLEVPRKLAELCRREGCHMMLLSGDLFDGPWTQNSLDVLRSALEEAAVPVFISPGNHDFCGAGSPYLTENWPRNVHIFTRPEMESVAVENLDCRVYGAGYRSMDCPPLLEDFRAEGEERYHVAVLHGDPTQATSPYSPITTGQVRESGLHYIALGHVHKSGSLRAGETLCAWPGCPMGRGYDELETKGVLIVTVEDTAEAVFVPLGTPRFYDLETSPSRLADVLPAVGNDHFYRITLTGESPELDLAAMMAQWEQFPNLELRDRTVPEVDIWGSADADSLEGAYFRILKEAMEGADEQTRQELELAARISRKILDGQEVVL